jgi:hypothetical protein
VSFCVQSLPSLHAVPFGAGGSEQTPVAELQVPATWQESLAVHATGLDPAHEPDWQVSVRVHALPSLQAVPFGAGEPPPQTPATQNSFTVQILPSLQIWPFGCPVHSERGSAFAHEDETSASAPTMTTIATRVERARRGSLSGRLDVFLCWRTCE